MYPLNQCSCLFEKYSMIALANSRTIDRMLTQTRDSIYTHLPTSFPSVQKPCLESIYMRALCFEPSLELALMRLLQVTVRSLHIELRFVEPCRRQTKKSRIYFLLSLTAISKRIKQRPVCDISWFFARSNIFVCLSFIAMRVCTLTDNASCSFSFDARKKSMKKLVYHFVGIPRIFPIFLRPTLGSIFEPSLYYYFHQGIYEV